MPDVGQFKPVLGLLEVVNVGCDVGVDGDGVLVDGIPRSEVNDVGVRNDWRIYQIGIWV